MANDDMALDDQPLVLVGYCPLIHTSNLIWLLYGKEDLSLMTTLVLDDNSSWQYLEE